MVGPEGLEPPTPGLKVRTLISRSVPLPTEEARSVREFDLSFPSYYRPVLCYSAPPVSYPLAPPFLSTPATRCQRFAERRRKRSYRVTGRKRINSR